MLWRNFFFSRQTLFCFMTELPEPAFKGILKLLYPTIGVYRDAKSLQAALKLVQAVAKKQPVFTIKFVSTLLSSFSEAQKKTVVER